MDLNQFEVFNESEDHYEVGHPNGRKLSIKKSGLSEKAHKLIQSLKEKKQFAEGGAVDPLEVPDYLKPNPPQVPEYLAPNSPEVVPVQNPETNISLTPEAPAKPSEVAVQPKAIANQAATDKLFNTQVEANNDIANAQMQQAGAEANAIQGVQNKISLMDTQQKIIQKYRDKDAAFEKMLDEQKIDPNRYLNSRTTGTKIAQGIALVLGGIGAGLTGQANPALGLIKDHIDRDIEAQKNDQSKTMNLWKMNREALGNDLAANLATQSQLYTGLQYQLKKAAVLSGSKVAMANAKIANSEIELKRQDLATKLAKLQIGMGRGGQESADVDPALLIPDLVPEARQKEVFDEIQTAQNIKRERKNILETFDKAAKDVRPLSGGQLKNMIPGVESEYNQALEQLLGPTLGKLEGTVRQAAMDNLKHNALPQMGDNENKIAVKRKALIHYLESAASAPTAKGFGVDLSKFKSTSIDPRIDFTPEQRQYYDWAINNSTDPRAKMVLKKLGVE